MWRFVRKQNDEGNEQTIQDMENVPVSGLRLAAGSIPGVGWTRLSALMMGSQRVRHGRFKSADKRCTARIAGIAFRRTFEVKPLPSQGPPCQGQVPMGTR